MIFWRDGECFMVAEWENGEAFVLAIPYVPYMMWIEVLIKYKYWSSL